MQRTILYLFYLLLALIPIDGFFVLELDLFSPSHLIVPILFLLMLVNLKNKININSEAKILLLFVITAFVISIFGLNLASSVYRLAVVFYYVVIYILIFNIVANYNVSFRAIIFSYSLPLLFLTLYASFAGLTFLNTGRLSYAEEYNPTWIAAHLIVIVILSFKYYENFKKVFIPSVLILLSIYFIILTQGRLSLFALIASTVITIVFLFVKNLGTKYKISFGVIILVAFTFFINYETIVFDVLAEQTRLQSTLEFGENYDTAAATANRDVRFLQYVNFIITTDPLPVGVGNSPFAVGVGSAHNMLLSLFVEVSVVGLLVYLWFLYILFKKSKSVSSLILSLFLVLFSFGNDVLYYKYFFMLLYTYIIINEKIYEN